jgi:hypothetical protein
MQKEQELWKDLDEFFEISKLEKSDSDVACTPSQDMAMEDDTRKKNRSIRQCLHKNTIRTNECDSVCMDCGTVLSDTIMDFRDRSKDDDSLYSRAQSNVPDILQMGRSKNPRHAYGSYDRIFHLNERLAAMRGEGPRIKDDIWKLFEDTYKEARKKGELPSPEKLTKSDIHRLCRLIKVPKELQEKYRSKKYLKKPHADCMRYAEKWIEIRYKLGGKKPPSFSDEDIQIFQKAFKRLLVPFNIYRHKPGCDGRYGVKCHKKCTRKRKNTKYTIRKTGSGSPEKECCEVPCKIHRGCRYSFPNYNYLLFQICICFGLEDKYGHILPGLTTLKKLKELDELVGKMFAYLYWDFVPLAPIMRLIRKKKYNPNASPPPNASQSALRKHKIARILYYSFH